MYKKLLNEMESNVITRHPVVEFMNMPDAIREELKRVYAESDHIPILNGAYTRYPEIFPFDEEESKSPIDLWLFSQGVTVADEFVIIHFDW